MSQRIHMVSSPHIYIASSSEPTERRAAQWWMRRAEEHGFVVTHDWVSVVDAALADLSDDEARIHAEDDADGVLSANVFWMQSSLHKSEGAAFELGLAVCKRRLNYGMPRVIVSGPSTNIFRLLGDIEHYPTHAEAWGALRSWCVPQVGR